MGGISGLPLGSSVAQEAQRPWPLHFFGQKKWPMLCNSELEIVSSSQTLEQNLHVLETEPRQLVSSPALWLGTRQLGLCMRQMRTCIISSEVLVFQQLSLSESLCFITLCHVLCCYFIFITYQRLHFAEIGSETTSKKQNFPGRACPQTPLVSACFARC